MRITVLGKSPAWQDAGGACSGYLVEADACAVLLDCGNGVFSKLRSHLEYLEVDAVVITHLHADHILDLVPVRVGAHLRAAPAARAGRRPSRAPPRPPGRGCIAPAGAAEAFRRCASAPG